MIKIEFTKGDGTSEQSPFYKGLRALVEALDGAPVFTVSVLKTEDTKTFGIELKGADVQPYSSEQYLDMLGRIGFAFNTINALSRDPFAVTEDGDCAECAKVTCLCGCYDVQHATQQDAGGQFPCQNCPCTNYTHRDQFADDLEQEVRDDRPKLPPGE